jgi:periplasmic divalent cation tolerance protein
LLGSAGKRRTAVRFFFCSFQTSQIFVYFSSVILLGNFVKHTGELLILTTVAETDQATVFARGLVEARLAACVSVLPGATSFYRWKSEAIAEDREIMLLIKTHRQKLTEVEAYFREHHPYECPEFVMLDVETSEGYGRWLRGELEIKAES